MNFSGTLKRGGMAWTVAISAAGAALALSPNVCAQTEGMDTESAGEQASSPSLKLSEAISNGHLLLEMRPRYNHITETFKPEKTDACTYRTLLGWQTAPFHNLRLTAQAIHTGIVGARKLNTDPDQFFSSKFPLLPDPPTSGMNQLFVDYSGSALGLESTSSTRVRVGRQILKIDNERFISDVDFRQTPLVFDGVTVINNDIADTEIYLGEYRRLRNVLGDTSRLRLTVLHGAWNPAMGHSIGVYGYWHNTPSTGAFTGFANNAQRITGARAEGAFNTSNSGQWLYYAEYAHQSAIGGGDSRINANYYRLGGGYSLGDSGARLDHEVKGSNRGAYGFQTPLTDFYAFNGWALQYTSTPPKGLRDTWITMRHMLAKVDGFVEYHQFKSDFGNLSLGHEWDASLLYPIQPNLTAKLQIARFIAGGDAAFKNNVNKTWLAFTYRY